MTKIANSYYSAVVSHQEMPGIYMSTFAVPGDPPQWVLDEKGRPKYFRSSDEAELAGFRLMAAKLNRARQEQEFRVKGRRNKHTRVWTAPPEDGPTIDTVFGKKQ
ncbi:hypothetical protein [Bradyrhizobium sp. DASA03007]|uniref:hypothetical protein n=1 Tax=unclassified Bradyrhizobium TaxID=2631580 RepID=UPI003F72CDE5